MEDSRPNTREAPPEEALPFFSIIVPAHNEEEYIAATLEHIQAQTYPIDRFEVLVIENGSSDQTYAISRRYERNNVQVHTYSARGVSFARNRGLEHMSDRADWVIFLDADTRVASTFLSEVAQALNGARRVACGTTRVQPDSLRVQDKAWFRVYDVIHAIFHNSWCLFFVRADVARAHRFNERAVLMEDVQYLRAAQQHGSFRFIDTATVYTSTRRMRKDGWLSLILLYTWVGLMPPWLQEHFGYDIVR